MIKNFLRWLIKTHKTDKNGGYIALKLPPFLVVLVMSMFIVINAPFYGFKCIVIGFSGLSLLFLAALNYENEEFGRYTFLNKKIF